MNKKIVKVLLIAILLGLVIKYNVVLAQTPTPSESCTCTGYCGLPWSVTISTPPETRTCLQVCQEEADLECDALPTPYPLFIRCTYIGNLQCSDGWCQPGRFCTLITGPYPSCACQLPTPTPTPTP